VINLKILIPLANGFEEIEAITCIDILRRAEIKVITASISNSFVTGSHDIIIKTDTHINNIKTSEINGIILPGGMPGAINLSNNHKIIEILKVLVKEGKLIAAICAAPIVLEKAGVLSKIKATSYPGFEKEMLSCKYKEDRIVLDNNIITARGPGVTLDFAMEIVNYLKGKEMVQQLKKIMLI